MMCMWLGAFLGGLACPSESPWYAHAICVLGGMLIGVLADGMIR